MLNVKRFVGAIDELADEVAGISRAPRESGISVRMKWFAVPVTVEALLDLLDLGRIVGQHPVVAGGLEVFFHEVERRQQSALAIHDDALLMCDEETGIAPLDFDTGRFHLLEERIVQPFARSLCTVQHDAHPDPFFVESHHRVQEQWMRESELFEGNRFVRGIKKIHDRLLAIVRLYDQLWPAHVTSAVPLR